MPRLLLLLLVLALVVVVAAAAAAVVVVVVRVRWGHRYGALLATCKRVVIDYKLLLVLLPIKYYVLQIVIRMTISIYVTIYTAILAIVPVPPVPVPVPAPHKPTKENKWKSLGYIVPGIILSYILYI